MIVVFDNTVTRIICLDYTVNKPRSGLYTGDGQRGLALQCNRRERLSGVAGLEVDGVARNKCLRW